MHATTFRSDATWLRLAKALAFTIAALAVAVAAAGCGDDETTTGETAATGATAGAETINVDMKEYSITPEKSEVAAGDVKFNVSNTGKLLHEFLVIKTDLAPDKLPASKAQPGKIDEDARDLTVIGEIEDLEPGETDDKTFKVDPGKYVLICNIAGHYKAGQYVALTVK